MQKVAFFLGIIFLGLFCVASIFQCSLWDDEANTALSAKAILNTGGLSAHVDDHNLLMYRNG
ncbi:MAG: hypothetical protein EBV19_09820, partial [Flavobacteriia bacterium]|nr:hypothetical protein [Flavobacteriia bacterium]